MDSVSENVEPQDTSLYRKARRARHQVTHIHLLSFSAVARIPKILTFSLL